MSNFEFFAGFVSAVLAIRVWSSWYADLLNINRFGAPRSIRITAGLVPAFSLCTIIVVVPMFAARAVRESLFYTIFYILVGAAWVGLASTVVPFLGISFRDDVLERRNTSAAWPTLAAIVAFGLCYAGGNIGEGPGPEAVFGSAALATCSLLLSWLLLEVFTGNRVSEAITVERDLASGYRLAGFLVAGGLILGTAAAGDWDSGTALVRFGRIAWLTLILVIIESFVQRILQPKLPKSASAAIGVLYVMAAVAYAWMRVVLR